MGGTIFNTFQIGDWQAYAVRLNESVEGIDNLRNLAGYKADEPNQVYSGIPVDIDAKRFKGRRRLQFGKVHKKLGADQATWGPPLTSNVGSDQATWGPPLNSNLGT